MARSKPKFYRRAFLNKAGFESHAHVLAEIDRFGGNFAVMDCTRVASLNFPLDSRDRANSLYKVRRLREYVNEFADALEAEAERRKRSGGGDDDY